MNQTPTIGRVVHFTTKDVTLPAIITSVGDDAATARLVVFGYHGSPAENVTAAFSALPAPGCWSWPPRVP